MKTFLRVSLWVFIAGVLSVTGFSRSTRAFRAAQPVVQQDASVQVIDVTAKKYSFTPSPIHVKKGTKVQLRITAVDHTHGFKINVYPDGGSTNGTPGLDFTSAQDCWKLPKGETVTVEFVARSVGHYPFKCCKFCGFGHMGMKGELIVDE